MFGFPCLCVCVYPQIFELASFAMEITTSCIKQRKTKVFNLSCNSSAKLETQIVIIIEGAKPHPLPPPCVGGAREYVKISTSTPVIYGKLPSTLPPLIVYIYFIYSKSKSQQCIQLKSGIEKWLTGSLHVLPGRSSSGRGCSDCGSPTMGLGYILIFDHNNLLSRPTDDVDDDDDDDNDKVSTI